MSTGGPEPHGAPAASRIAATNSDLPAKLNKFFEVMRRPEDPPLSNPAAAQAITEKTGVPISATYLWQLRCGIKTNPTVRHVRAIAEFFGVPPAYLIEPETIDDDQLRLLQALRDKGVRDLAFRTYGLSPEAIGSLAAMVDELRKLQNLPPVNSE